MSQQPLRLPSGGLIDRSQPLEFSFNGKLLHGYAGDTLASALIANDVRLVGRSFKYHRPRGIVSAGSEEPNALLHVGPGAYAEPNTRATQVQLTDGLRATSQNHWPALEFDLLSFGNVLSPLFSAGFYNKTFKWPRRFWPGYEKMLRRAAGHGRAPRQPGPDHFEQLYRHCEVLIVGAGPAGLAAAACLANSGIRVIIADECDRPGGCLLKERASIAGEDGIDWCSETLRQLGAADNIEIMSRTTAFGFYDHQLVALAEQLPFDGSEGAVSQRLHRVRAKQVILAGGSIERPLVFANNDLPGIMLAGATRAYLHQYGVMAGRKAVVYTGNDSAYRSAIDLHDAGVKVAALADLRESPCAAGKTALVERGIPVYTGARLAAHGRKVLRSVSFCHAASGQAVRLDCDLLCVSGGWTPSLHLHSQSGGEVRFDRQLDSFVPGTPKQDTITAGAINGLHGLQECLDDGEKAAKLAAARCGIAATSTGASVASQSASLAFESPCRPVKQPGHNKARRLGIGLKGKHFVDLQNDVTIKDVKQAFRESYISVEHLKRYTTLGMGTDQGKTSNLNGLGLLAELREEPIPSVGLTTFRPPYTPVTLGTLAGQSIGPRLSPTRRTVLHSRHERAGAEFDFNGLWLRPRCYLQPGETADDAIQREAMAVRTGVGLTDISTLGKFEIQGDDCIEFLDRVYVNNMQTLKVGRSRYGLMLREDGMVLDDGTVTRLAEQHYFITTSTGHAEHVLQHLEFLLGVLWPELDVSLVQVTEQWAGMAVAGPHSRELLERVSGPGAVALDSIPYMACGTLSLPFDGGEIPARLIRISYSGELAYEIYVPSRSGPQAWDMFLERGAGLEIQPYGMDAMDVLRIEKGFIVVGADADGRTTPMDIGMGRWVANAKKAFIGHLALNRPALNEPGRLQLVGLEAQDRQAVLSEGAQLTQQAGEHGYDASIGHVSSAGFSPLLERYVALALVMDGRSRMGETIYSTDPARGNRKPAAVTIIQPCVYDPDGSRLRA